MPKYCENLPVTISEKIKKATASEHTRIGEM